MSGGGSQPFGSCCDSLIRSGTGAVFSHGATCEGVLNGCNRSYALAHFSALISPTVSYTSSVLFVRMFTGKSRTSTLGDERVGASVFRARMSLANLSTNERHT